MGYEVGWDGVGGIVTRHIVKSGPSPTRLIEAERRGKLIRAALGWQLIGVARRAREEVDQAIVAHLRPEVFHTLATPVADHIQRHLQPERDGEDKEEGAGVVVLVECESGARRSAP